MSVYKRVCMVIQVLFFLLFLILSVEEGATLFTSKKFTVFPGVTKVRPISPNFMRGYPFEPHRPPEKVTYSDHFGGGKNDFFGKCHQLTD